MSVGLFELATLEGEYVDGPAHTQAAVDLQVRELGERLELIQTARHKAVPDRSIRSELDREEVVQLRDELDRILAD